MRVNLIDQWVVFDYKGKRRYGRVIKNRRILPHLLTIDVKVEIGLVDSADMIFNLGIKTFHIDRIGQVSINPVGYDRLIELTDKSP